MNAIEHWVAQNKDAPLLQSEAEPEINLHGDRPCILVYGPQIDALHSEGMKLVDVARKLGLNYNGLRGIYSRYRKIVARTAQQ